MRTILVSLFFLITNILYSQNRILDIPQLKILPTIDGVLNEWNGKWTHIESPYINITENMKANFMAGWSSDTLYLAYQINDTTPSNILVNAPYWNDCVSIELSMDSTIEIFKLDNFNFAIGQRDNSSIIASEELKSGLRIKASGNSKIYKMEWAIPFRLLKNYVNRPKLGDKISFNTSVTDNTSDTTNGIHGMTQKEYWYPDGEMASGYIFCGYLKLSSNKYVGIQGVHDLNLDYKYYDNKIEFENTCDVLLNDISGRLIINKKKTNHMNFEHIPNGIYFLTINKTMTVKIIK